VNESDDQTRSVSITRFDSPGPGETASDLVVREELLRIMVNGKELAIASVLPAMFDEFVHGLLLAAGIIDKREDVLCCDMDSERGVAIVDVAGMSALTDYAEAPVLLGSACGADPLAVSTHKLTAIDSRIRISYSAILAAGKELLQRSRLFRDTGGVHSVSLNHADGTAIVHADDIGRHNAFDKVAGAVLLGGIDPTECFAVCTGRLSSEIVTKAWRLGLPVLVSRSAATSRGVDIAQDAGITLVGFARGKRFNVYSHAERITPGDAS
jgi:FdhD protein